MNNDEDDLIYKWYKRFVLAVIVVGTVAAILLILIVIWWGLERAFNLETPKEFRNTQQSVVYQWESPVLQFQTLGCLTGNPLIDCFIKGESSGNPDAYNPKDVDGRPKYGLLQFDSRTFDSYCVKTYKLDDDIWNPEIQRVCCQKMIDDGLAYHWGTYKKCKALTKEAL